MSQYKKFGQRLSQYVVCLMSLYGDTRCQKPYVISHYRLLPIHSFMNPTLGNINQKSRTFFFALEFVDPTSSFVEQSATQVEEVSLRRLLYSQKWCLCFEIRCAWNPKPHLLQNFNFTMYYHYIQPDQPCESRCCWFYYMHQPYVAG